MDLMIFVRTFSQTLQAFTPIALSLAWFEQSGDTRTSSAIRRGLIASIPATVVASRLFQQSTHQALDEAVLAAIAMGVTSIFARNVWRHAACRLSPWAVALLAALIVVRQTMEVGASFAAAAIDLKLFLPTMAILSALASGAGLAWTMKRLIARFPDRERVSATLAFAGVFFIQALIYAFHEFSEARLLPASDLLHSATEPYGPDGIYGVHVSHLLVIAPLLAAAVTFARSRVFVSPRFRLVAPSSLAVLGLAIAALVLTDLQRAQSAPSGDPSTALRAGPPTSLRSGPSTGLTTVEAVAAIASRPHLLFRDLTRTAPAGTRPHAGLLSLVPLDDPHADRVATEVPCERISFAAGHGLCLQTTPGIFPRYTAVVLDGRMQPLSSIALEGRPSRTRTSGDGRIGAITVFVFGHNYAAPFSTRTTLVDMSGGDVIGELEQFSTWRNGARVRGDDFNFWGVTFAADPNTFYATLRTGSSTYLVRGDLVLRRLTILRDNVECPSLSPDNRLIAFKKRVGPGASQWRLAVLNLETMTEHVIEAETRSIDDQVEWLDSGHVLYAVPGGNGSLADVWVAAIDGSTPARIFLPEADSPIAVR
jgi:hypothetical protein